MQHIRLQLRLRCRKGPYDSRKKRDVSSNSTVVDDSQVSNVLKKADKNEDGMISMVEELQYLDIQLPHFSNETKKTELMNLDLNKDGFLSDKEIDSMEL
ncbi:hypothetical protein U1Q18_049609 [Sarracenia purpurea var. burkii]